MDYIERKKISGKKQHNKRNFGGLRFLVLDRDGYKCTRCGITEKDHVDLHSRELHVHHIDKNPSHNELNNLVTLCSECHMVEHDRFRAKEDKLEMVRLRNSGMSYRAIGEHFGITKQAVHAMLKVIHTN